MVTMFQCTVVTPEAQILDEQVSYVSIPAHDGQVGLAHLRAPMLVKLGDGPLRIDDAEGQSRWFFVGGGFAQMRDDKLTVLTNEAVAVDEIDRSQAQADLEQALTMEATSDEQVAQRHRRQTRARAMMALAGQQSG